MIRRTVAVGMLVGGLAALGQERGLPPAPAPGGIVRTPGQPPRVEAPVERAVEVPVRRGTAAAFGERVVVEVRGMAVVAADAALREAVAEIAAVEALADPWGDGALAALNAAAGSGPRPVDERLADLLARALRFCDWSRGAHGPLGGRLSLAWGLDGAGGGRGIPAPEEVRQAAGAASCDGLSLDEAAGTASLAPGRRLDLRGFARGFAVDRAFEVLRRHGVEDLYVEVGGVRRAAGDGPHGRGWPVTLPAFAGMERPLDRLQLRDRALAVVSTGERPLEVGGDRRSPWLDQRSGRPAEGVVATLAASELAADAEALAVALTVLGNREGMLRLSGLQPTPSVLWLLGDGDGPLLEVPYRWTGF